MRRRPPAASARMIEAQARGVKAHRAAAKGDESDVGAGKRATRRDSVRARPASEARLPPFAVATDHAGSRRSLRTGATVMRPNEMCGSTTPGRIGALPPGLSSRFDQMVDNALAESSRKSPFWSAIRGPKGSILRGQFRPSRCLPESATQSRSSIRTPARRGLLAVGLDALSCSMASAILLAWAGPKSRLSSRTWTR